MGNDGSALTSLFRDTRHRAAHYVVDKKLSGEASAVNLFRVVPKKDFLSVVAERVAIKLRYLDIALYVVDAEECSGLFSGLVTEGLYAPAVIAYGCIGDAVRHRGHLLDSLRTRCVGRTVVGNRKRGCGSGENEYGSGCGRHISYVFHESGYDIIGSATGYP